MLHWASMTKQQMVCEFRNLFSAEELREQLAASDKVLADYERMIGFHRGRRRAILLVLKEKEGHDG